MANVNTNYYNTAQYKNAQGLQNETLSGLAQKYGFDFSQNYANNQANTAAQAQINAQNAATRDNNATHTTTMSQIQNDFNNAGRNLDTNYFNQFQNTGQNMADRGLNAGIAANANLQLGMNKQRDLAGLWQTRSMNTQQENMRYGNTQQTIADALTQIQKEKAANAQKMYQDLLTQGYGLLQGDRNYGLQLDNSAWNKYQDMFSNDMQTQQLALQKQAAARAAAASRAAASAPAVSFKGNGSSALSSALNAYNAAKPSVSAAGSLNTPLDKYYTTPAIQAMESAKASMSPTIARAIGDPLPPAQNGNLSAWEKMKLMGL